MAAVDRERIAAATIFGLAVAIAFWVLQRPTVAPLPPIVTAATPAPLPLFTLMAPVEMTDLPAQSELESPAPSAKFSPPAPPPSAPPVLAPTPIMERPPAAAPPPPLWPLEPVRMPAQLLAPPLRPTPEPTKANARSTTVLKPASPKYDPAVESKFAPLKPYEGPTGEKPTRTQVVPLKVEAEDIERLRAARENAKAVALLRPEQKEVPLPPVARVFATTKPVSIAPPAKPAAVDPPKPSAPQPELLAIAKPAITTASISEGRELLRLLEEGTGPSIQIGWPSAPPQRDKLYRLFVQCFGMRVGLVDSGGRLYLGEGKPGEPSAFDTERYSGFVRRPKGAMAADEQREVGRLSAFHHTDAAPVRVFPRQVDAYLMSSLRQAVGDGYLSLKSIRAAYRLSNGQVMIASITADGRAVKATIDLATVSNGCAE